METWDKSIGIKHKRDTQSEVHLKSNKFWIILLGSVLAGSAIITLLLWNAPASFARISKEGVQITAAVNLLAVTEAYTIIIDETAEAWSSGGFNVVEIDNKRVRMLEADCPDGLCVRQGWVSSGLVPVVCLPNRVVITFEGNSNDTGVDAVVG